MSYYNTCSSGSSKGITCNTSPFSNESSSSSSATYLCVARTFRKTMKELSRAHPQSWTKLFTKRRYSNIKRKSRQTRSAREGLFDLLPYTTLRGFLPLLLFVPLLVLVWGQMQEWRMGRAVRLVLQQMVWWYPYETKQYYTQYWKFGE